MKKLEICSKPCENCLFSDNKIVSDERAEQIIEDVIKGDSFFVCHESSIEGGNVCCNGFYKKHKYDSLITRTATMFKQVKFVKVESDSARDLVSNRELTKIIKEQSKI